MQGEGVALVDKEAFAESEIELGILGVTDIKKPVVSIFLLSGSRCFADGVEQIACCF